MSRNLHVDPKGWSETADRSIHVGDACFFVKKRHTFLMVLGVTGECAYGYQFIEQELLKPYPDAHITHVVWDRGSRRTRRKIGFKSRKGD